MGRHNRAVGFDAEEEAVQFLRANHYEILDRNWRWKRSEIDIIARIGDELVFIEVKSRKNAAFGYPEEFLSEAQEERIYWAAEAYCEQIGWQGNVRFDIIAILQSDFPNHLEHLEDAF